MMINGDERIGGMPDSIGRADTEAHCAGPLGIILADSDVPEPLSVPATTVVGNDAVVVQMLHQGSDARVHTAHRTPSCQDE